MFAEPGKDGWEELPSGGSEGQNVVESFPDSSLGLQLLSIPEVTQTPLFKCKLKSCLTLS